MCQPLLTISLAKECSDNNRRPYLQGIAVYELVKEGKIPTGTQQSKPEGLMNSTQISRKSLRDEVPIGQVSDNVNIRSSASMRL